MPRILPMIGAALCLSFSSLHAGALLEEKWEGQQAGADVMQSGRWSMAQGLPSELMLVKRPGTEELYLKGSATGGGIALSIARFELEKPGVELSVRLIQSADMPEEEQFQFGFRGADSGGALTDSYRVRVTATEIYVNRFPTPRMGKQQIIGKAPIPGNFREGESERVMTFRLKPVSERELIVEVLVDDAPVIRATSRTAGGDGLPTMGSAVRAFFLSGPNTLIRGITVDRAK